ncbi:hypothetical protein ACTXT7_004556 [Hymenolepis weldensis]
MKIIEMVIYPDPRLRERRQYIGDNEFDQIAPTYILIGVDDNRIDDLLVSIQKGTNVVTRDEYLLHSNKDTTARFILSSRPGGDV